jgi:hypothetical protein
VRDERYLPPQAELTGPAGLEAKIFTLRQIWFVAFLGSPLSGALAMARNSVALGRPGERLRMLAGGVAGSGLLLALGFALPQSVTRTLPLLLVIAVHSIAKAAQGDEIERHLAAGGARQSWWSALLVSVIGVAGFLGAAFVIGFVLTAAGVIQGEP